MVHISRKVLTAGLVLALCLATLTGCDDTEKLISSAGQVISGIADKATERLESSINGVHVVWNTPGEDEVLWQDFKDCPPEFLAQFNKGEQEDAEFDPEGMEEVESSTASVDAQGNIIFTQEVLGEGSIKVESITDSSAAVQGLKEGKQKTDVIESTIDDVLGTALSNLGKAKDDFIKRFPNGTLEFEAMSEYSADTFDLIGCADASEDGYQGMSLVFRLQESKATEGYYNPQVVIKNSSVVKFSRVATMTIDRCDLDPDELVDMLIGFDEISSADYQVVAGESGQDKYVFTVSMENPNLFLTMDRLADNAIRVGLERGMEDCLTTNPELTSKIRDGIESGKEIGKEITDRVQSGIKNGVK